MIRGYGKGHWNGTLRAVSIAALALMFVGVTPLAFAEGEGNMSELGETLREESSAEAPNNPIESAFMLGDVTITCTPLNDASAALALGEQVDHAYLVANEGEPAYVRLASSLVCGDLSRAVDRSVSDVPVRGSDTEAGERDGVREQSASAWYLAEDGWWYRIEPLSAGETVEVHVSVEIPSDDAWKRALSAGATNSLKEVTNVGAVQARNMDVDSEAERPWGGFESKAFAEESADGENSTGEDPQPKSLVRKGGDPV